MPTDDPITAVVLLSGGLDSATTLALATHEGHACVALSFDYGQRHNAELESAKAIANAVGVRAHHVVKLDAGLFRGSALTDAIEVPKGANADTPVDTGQIPVTYVPARNLVFLSMATALAESLGAGSVFIGANAVDYSGYPDCRPEFIASFERTANLATKAGVESTRAGATPAIRILAPLTDLTKAEIIEAATELKLDLSLTTSCYDADAQGRACGRCDSCRLRARGFRDAGIPDPTRYVETEPASISSTRSASAGPHRSSSR